VGGERLADPKRPAGHGTPLDTLSEREREVLVLVAQGHTNQRVADHLHLSVKTIESYRSRLMIKLGLANRAELTQFALDAGLLGGR
jgi:two-component system response regulator NreC